MLGWVLGMAAAFTVIFFSLPKKPLDNTGATSKLIDGNGPANSSLCEKKLIKWIQSVDPERVQFNLDMESRISELNRYWTTCGSKGDEPIVSDLGPIESGVEGEYRQRVLSPRFSQRDIEHIRQSLLLSRIATRIGEDNQSDLDRTLAALVIVSQQIEPLPEGSAADHPLTPFECLLLGQGTGSDRAWVFAEILRQLHLDAVVLMSAEADISPLVAAIVKEDVYLFDPLLGLPVPSAGESQRKSIYREPATLKDALADDSIFRQLDLEGSPFPWTSERLKAATIRLVGTSSTWAPRIAELQFQWPTTQSCITYDGLGASAGLKRGLVERVSGTLTAFGFEPGRITVWDYPEQQSQKYDSLGAEKATHMAPLLALMSGPTTFEEVTDTKTGALTVSLVPSKRPLQRVRAQQLLGKGTEAINGYLPMLGAHKSAPKSGIINGRTQHAMDQNRLVSDRATYWMAATQFENGDISACAGTLRRYAQDFPLGEMREAAALRLAACLAKAQEYAAASQILAGIGPGNNQRRRLLLAKRLAELQGAKGETPAQSAVPK